MALSDSVVVTGGAGFIGSHLVERLLADGKSVVVIDDSSTGCEHNLQTVRDNPRLEWIRAEVSTCAELPERIRQAEVVFHLAATVGVERVLESALRAIESNLHATQAVLRAASVHKTKVVLASSSEVYGKCDREFLREDQELSIGPPTVVRWSYACGKLLEEFLALAHAREHQLPVVIARLFNAVGPRQSGRYGMVLPRFIAAARTGNVLRVFGSGKQSRCFCDVVDTVEALVRLSRVPQALGQIVNVGNAQELRILDLARLVVKTLGSNSPIQLVPYETAYAAGFEDLPRRRPDLTKLKQLTGFEPAHDLERVIRQTAQVADEP